jgi:6,7-dimethyl-8-ribityllumazine synthase
VKVDLSDLSDEEVDADGYLKPGVPLQKDGSIIASSGVVWGVTFGGEKVATGGTDTILDAATDCFVAVGFGLVNRDVAEDNLGRALTADEIAGFDLAGSNCRITRT